MNTENYNHRTGAFTLVEMLIVISIIAMLAAMTMGGYTYAMRSSKRRVTTGTFEAIKLAMERYNTEFGEYPEPASKDQMVEFVPGKKYDVSGAACLYQALTGDGFDQIKGVSTPSGSDKSSATSDGKIEGTNEIRNKMLAEIPQTIWRKQNGNYVIIDGFARPFQYMKATTSSPTAGAGASANSTSTTINSTYDLWSYAEDDVNITQKSIDTQQSGKSSGATNISAKWVKNW